MKEETRLVDEMELKFQLIQIKLPFQLHPYVLEGGSPDIINGGMLLRKKEGLVIKKRSPVNNAPEENFQNPKKEENRRK